MIVPRQLLRFGREPVASVAEHNLMCERSKGRESSREALERVTRGDGGNVNYGGGAVDRECNPSP